MKKWIALLLCMLMVCAMLSHSALAQTEQEEVEKATVFNFRNGITWDSTMEEVIASEGTEYGSLDGIITRWIDYSNVSVSEDSTAFIIYVFSNDELVGISCEIDDTSQEDWNELIEIFFSRYGKSAEINVEDEWKRITPYLQKTHLSILLRRYEHDGFFDNFNNEFNDELNDWNCWTLEDGTYLNIFRRYYGSDVQKQKIVILYINEPSLLPPSARYNAARQRFFDSFGKIPAHK